MRFTQRMRCVANGVVRDIVLIMRHCCDKTCRLFFTIYKAPYRSLFAPCLPF